ncbi:MAG TPA: LysE family translocator [Ktedonobacterales bacterium]
MGFFDVRFGAYLLVATLLIVTPGPDTALTIRNTLRGGRRAASFTALGIAVGSAVWAAASVFGVTAFLDASPQVFTIYKIVGAIYLVYLGARSLLGSFHTRGEDASDTPSSPPVSPNSSLTDFRQGLLSNLLNPKAGAIFITALPQFVVHGDPPARLLPMLLAYETILLVWLNLYGVVISRVGASRVGVRVGLWLERLTGVVLLALAVRLAFERR